MFCGLVREPGPLSAVVARGPGCTEIRAVAYGGDPQCTANGVHQCVGSATLANVASVECGGQACMGLKRNGTAEAWGHATYGGDPQCTANGVASAAPAQRRSST